MAEAILRPRWSIDRWPHLYLQRLGFMGSGHYLVMRGACLDQHCIGCNGLAMHSQCREEGGHAHAVNRNGSVAVGKMRGVR